MSDLPGIYIVSYWSYDNSKTFVGALRPYRMADFFKKKGWEVTLITPTSSNGTEFVVSENRWIRWPVFRAFPPDYTLLWAIKVLWAVRPMVNKSARPIYFLTSCPPNGLVMTGILGKMFFHSKIKWVLDFRDLWTQHPLYDPPITKKFLDPLIERWAIHSADLLLCNTAWDQVHWASRFPKHLNKLLTITNGFDQPIPNKTDGLSGQFRFVYTGGTTAGQATRWVHRWLSSFREMVGAGSCDFYGEYDAFMDTSPWINYRGVIKPDEVPALLSAYRFGFIYLPKGSESGGRVAQKFYDYLGAGVIPVCYRPSQEMLRLMAELHTGVCIGENDLPADILEALKAAEFHASPTQLAQLERNTQFEKLYNSLPSLP